LPCNWLVGALIIQYVRNLHVGVLDGVSQLIAKLKVVQGWSTSCAAGAHTNDIVPHQIGATLQGNASLACSAPRLSPFGQVGKGCSQLHNQT
jgi:hypothetical protein